MPHGHEQSEEVPVSASRDALDGPLPLLQEYLVDVPKIVDRVQQRVVEQNIEFPLDKFLSVTNFGESVEVVKIVCLERVSERSCEQGGFFEVSKISSQDQMLHDVLVPQMTEQLVDVPKIVFSRQNPATECRADR